MPQTPPPDILKWIILLSKVLFLTASFSAVTFLTFNSTYWLASWLALELSMVTFIPFTTSNKNPLAPKVIKHFIMQATASIIMIYLVTTCLWKTGHWGTDLMNFNMIIFVSIALATKLGAAPYCFWLSNNLDGTPRKMGFILIMSNKLILACTFIKLMTQLNIVIITIALPLFFLFWVLFPRYQTEMWKALTYSSMGLLLWTLLTLSYWSMGTPMDKFVVYAITSALFIAFYILSQMNISNLSIFLTYIPLPIHAVYCYYLLDALILMLLTHYQVSPFSFWPK